MQRSSNCRQSAKVADYRHRLTFDGLHANDSVGRASAFALVQAGMEIERAAALSGLLAGE